MKLKFVLTALLLSITTFAHAYYKIDLTDAKYKNSAKNWPKATSLLFKSFDEDTPFTKSYFVVTRTKDDYDFYSMEIFPAVSGKQSIYLRTNIPCERENKDSSSIGKTALKVNGKNVMMNAYCSSVNERYYTPTSDEGFDYTVYQFKTSKVVNIANDNIHLFFDAMGFTKAWNNFGGDAI